MGNSWDYLFDDQPAEAPPPAPVDAGPAARRAAAGMPPAPASETAPEPVTLDKAPSAFDQNRAALGKVIGTPRPFVGPDGRTIQYATAADPMAQGVVMTPVLGPAGKAISAGASKVIGPALAPVAAGGVTGAAAAKSMGGDAAEGAAFGMALPALRVALGGVGEAEARAMAARGDARLYRELGSQATSPKVQADLQRLGKERVGKISRELNLTNAPDKRAVVANDLQATGQAIGHAYDALDAVPTTSRSTGQLMQAANKVRGELQAKFGQAKGEELFAPVETEIQRLWDSYSQGQGPNGKIPLSELNKAARGFEQTGFSGGSADKLSPAAQKVAARAVAQVINGELDAGLDLAAQDPALAPAVNRLHDLNSRYRTLKVIEPVANRMSRADDFGRRTVPVPPGGRGMVRRVMGAAMEALPRAGDRLAAVRGAGSMAGSPSDVIPLAPATYGALKAGNRQGLEAQMAAELFPK